MQQAVLLSCWKKLPAEMQGTTLLRIISVSPVYQHVESRFDKIFSEDDSENPRSRFAGLKYLASWWSGSLEFLEELLKTSSNRLRAMLAHVGRQRL